MVSYHNGMKFTTFDQDNDRSTANCAEIFHGAWWYNWCYTSNLNGRYFNGGVINGTGIVWGTFNSTFLTLKSSTMMIRPY